MRHKFPLIMLAVFILASVHLAHAQQAKKVSPDRFSTRP